ncbi:PREDICTED: uncharacterized protein LOC109243458 [Nicotiana attenuata]|uniref:uncharacterized protein LOC109243458 n=1 Tax=Nicotiana attenuata TaxID=49451 RepID=UPI0009053D81|nr:PREDICTED: uncharacterized protein LOC109243458 [Nicotiana attenuata]
MEEIRDFKNCVENCSLLDLKSSGAFFTWANKQSRGDMVRSRIVKVMVNAEWGINLPASMVHYRSDGLFDHYPAIISWENGSQPKNKRVRYFNMWSMALDFKEKIKAGWWTDRKGTEMYELVRKLNKIKRTLQELNKDRFSKVELKADEAIQKFQKCHEKIQLDLYNIHLIAEETNLSQECKTLNVARENS